MTPSNAIARLRDHDYLVTWHERLEGIEGGRWHIYHPEGWRGLATVEQMVALAVGLKRKRKEGL